MKALDFVLRLPDLWNARFLLLFVAGSAIGTVILCAMGGSGLAFPALLAVCSSLLGGFAWVREDSLEKMGADKRSTSFSPTIQAWVLEIAGLVVACVGLGLANSVFLGWLAGLYPFALVGLWSVFFGRWRTIKVIGGGLALGGPFFLTAAIMGKPFIGLFPGVLIAMLGFVALWIRDLETTVFQSASETEDIRVHVVYGKSLAWISTLLFVFGVVSLWPWLGELYGQRYFWILVIGVLSPILFFWGRLRQPRTENSLTALVRLNRVLPYTGVILLIAFLFG